MKCKKCKKEFLESELKDGLCDDCINKKISKEKNNSESNKISTPLYTKWWFWVCIVILTLIVSFIILIVVVYSYMEPITSETANKIKSINSEVALYVPTNGDTVIVEIPDYSKVNLEELDKIKETIKNEANNVFTNCTKLALVTKLKDNISDNNYISVAVYNLPSMELNTSLSKSYMDVTTTNNSNSTLTQTTPTPVSTTPENTKSEANLEEKGEDVILTLGTYEVGVDIKPGKYDLIAQSGMGDVITKGSESKAIMLSVNENEYYSTKYNNITLKKGDIVEIISKLEVLFQAK